MQHHSQANYAEILATDTHAGLGVVATLMGVTQNREGFFAVRFL